MIEQAAEQPSELRFRKIEPRDLDDVLEIEQEAFPEPWTRGMFCQEISSAMSHFFVALVDDVLVGYVGFWQVADEAHITSVTVRKEYRGRGYGRALTNFIVQAAAREGLTRATLEVRVTNTVAQNLYKSLGFEKTGIRKSYYKKTNEDAIIMARKLDACVYEPEHAKS
ncbi:MAG: ribosomal protein S18-alanine N-acetyltransferase [Candidatus Hydrogenedentes bacterium]|nr:ribosomal protein S18-alanine N-acetyltransferase [Candidatus Hydrogenedentota bacterium]